MRLATVLEDGAPRIAVVDADGVLGLPADDPSFASMRAIAAGGSAVLARIADWAAAQPAAARRSVGAVTLAPAVVDPGAIYTIGHNYRSDPGAPDDGPPRPLVYGKAAASVAADGATLAWDRSLTANVDAECELGVVIGASAFDVSVAEAMDHVLGYTIINDVSSRDAWLDGDQWLIGKSLPGFCPVGPWVVTADALDPTDLGIGCTINGVAIQDGRTGQMRVGIPEVVSYLSRHVRLQPGDLIATGTPARLPGPMGPERHLEPGDVVVAWIEGIGALTTPVA
jgi:2-keto-4-pentenoate hydratase/2-oxohepta-3-ene-1,7-dioic acid hydratase in catechol pathway